MANPVDKLLAADSPSWGSWEDAEHLAHAAFQGRSPVDRLAWLEDLLRLKTGLLSEPVKAKQGSE
jgi:hypothetical protein